MSWIRDRAWSVHAVRYVYAKLSAVRLYWRAMRARPGLALSFLFADPELDNFTYEVGNLDELTDVLVDLLSAEHARVRAYMIELEDDVDFRAELATKLRGRQDRKSWPHYGRRAGWYCLVRLLRPALVVEAGVHDGLGSAVFLNALERNRAEGYAGRLIGIDIDSTCGWLVPDRLRSHFQLVIDDSVASLRRISSSTTINLFLHDSSHTYAHQMLEYDATLEGLAADGVVISDDAHASDALKDFSAQHGRDYAFWGERPVNHFYPGVGIGISVVTLDC